MIGDAINPSPPNFELKIKGTKRANTGQHHLIWNRRKNMRINTKGIKAFLHDAKAVSPAIATLILIVIAAVAAAGVGILVQNAQTNAQQQQGNKDLSIVGTITVKGSTTVLPISEIASANFMKKYPGTQVVIGGGGSAAGQEYIYDKLVDIGASSSKWPDTDTTTNGVVVPGRGQSAVVVPGGIICSESGPDCSIKETAIGTGMIVIAGAAKNDAGNAITAINVTNDVVNSPHGIATGWTVLNLTFADLQTAYSAGTVVVPNGAGTITLEAVQRSDASGTEETFAQWIGQQDSNTKQLVTTDLATQKQGNQGISEYIAGYSTSSAKGVIGFVDIGFAKGGVNGNNNVIPALQNGTAAVVGNKGVGKTYDTASISNRLPATKAIDGKDHGLARDLYLYNQLTGDNLNVINAYLDYILSADGQKDVQAAVFFTI
ncbi:PBP superfamily domain protein [uncultured archaeon]|nr:PBP superfamily domain protein [uncultured archaeon]